MKKALTGSLLFLLALSSVQASIITQKIFTTTAGIFDCEVKESQILRKSYIERALNGEDNTISYSHCERVDEDKYSCNIIATGIPASELIDIHSEYRDNIMVDVGKIGTGLMIGAGVGLRFFRRTALGVMASAGAGAFLPMFLSEDSHNPYVHDYLDISTFSAGPIEVYIKSNRTKLEDQVNTISNIAHSLADALTEAQEENLLTYDVKINHVTELIK